LPRQPTRGKLYRMVPIAIALLAFALAMAGILLGRFMQRVLPEGNLSADSKVIVKLSMGVVATLAALVLGLLIASAKGTPTVRARVKSIRLPPTSSSSTTCWQNMEKGLTPHDFRCAKQFHQWSIKYGEKRSPPRCSLRHSRLRLRAKPSINRFANFNQAMTYNGALRSGRFRWPQIWRKRDFYSFRDLAVPYPSPFWRCCYFG
jgi:hypothetical protein